MSISSGHFKASGGSLMLEGVRVVDFSRMLPGPWATQMLGDLGAEVIKVEQKSVGDPSRYSAPVFKNNSAYFHSVNLNKKSVELDLMNDKDKSRVHDLIKSADVVVESFRVGVPDRLGIDFHTCCRLNPDIVYCSITGFGQNGPWSGIPGHDLVVQAVSGVMGANNTEFGSGVVPGFQASDYAAATYAVIGVLAAIHQVKLDGKARFMDISMFECVVNMMSVISGAALVEASGGERSGVMEVWGRNPRYSTYRTSDDLWVAVSLLETRVWEKFCNLIGHSDLVDPEETLADRHTVHGSKAEKYREVLEMFCGARKRDDITEWARRNRIPILPVLRPEEAFFSNHAVAREMIEWVEHPDDGFIAVLRNPLSRSGLTRPKRLHAPALGEHNELLEEK